MSKFRTWLTTNKIFFETVAALALVVASVFVSYLQWKTAERQVEIALRESAPDFIASTHLEKKDGEPNFSDEVLVVENFGGNAREASLHTSTWLKVIFMKGSIRYERSVPVYGYYFATETHSGSVRGILFRSTSDRNNEKYIQLTRSISDHARAMGFTTNVEMSRYAKINYKDILGRSHTEYFLVRPVIGSTLLGETEGRRWVDQCSKSPDFTDIDDLTPEKLFSLAQK